MQKGPWAGKEAEMVKLVFPDGNSVEYPAGTTGAQVAASVSRSLARKALAFSSDGALYDLSAPVRSGSSG